jgi:Mg-chelatase subunit ChlD
MNTQLLPDGIEPAIDVRLTALVLGEASDFEASQLHELMDQRPELAAWYGQLQILHGALNDWAVREQGKMNATPGESAGEVETWKLSADKRAKVLAVLGEEPANTTQKVLSVLPWQKKWGQRLRSKLLVISASVAASFVLLCSALMLNTSMKARYTVSQKASREPREYFGMPPAPNGPVVGSPAASTSGSDGSMGGYFQPGRAMETWDRGVVLPGAGPVELSKTAETTVDESGLMLGGDVSRLDAAPAPAPDVPSGMAAAPSDSLAELQSNGVTRENVSRDKRLGERGAEPLADMNNLSSQPAQASRAAIDSFDRARNDGRFEEQSSRFAESNLPSPLGSSTRFRQEQAQKPGSAENLPSSGAAPAKKAQTANDFAELFDTGGMGGMGGKSDAGRLAGGGSGAPPGMSGAEPADRKSVEKKESESGERMLSSSLGDIEGREMEELTVAESKVKEKNNLADKLALKDSGAENIEAGIVAGKERKLRRELREKKKPAVGLSETLTETERFSTFSLHVSDVSFKLALDSLSNGQWPEAAKIRLEEFLNAFDYQDPLPSEEEKVACRVEQATHPFLMQRNVLRVAMRTSAVGRSSITPLRLTLLLDNSGSMQRADRAQTVRRAFETLAAQLTPQDQVTLISFANEPKLRADRVQGNEILSFVHILENSPVEGGTNMEAALRLALEKSLEAKTSGAQSRVILMTDGAVNLGDADPDRLSEIILQMRDNGIAFDGAGISAQDLNDEVLEALARKGDGRYYLLDNAEQVDAGFAQQIAGALRPSAKNVKVQVEFNPQRVRSYKLLGFEKHLLNKEDFRNDQVDAAELAAAEAGNALYQYEVLQDGVGDVGSVSVRFQDLATGLMVEKRWPIPYETATPRLERASSSLRIATSAVLFAAHLKGEPVGESVDLKYIAEVLGSLDRSFGNVERVEQLRRMIESARQIAGASSDSR